MIHALVGESASGKTSIAKQLAQCGIPTIVSYTTRPQRKNETHGEDYYFIGEEEFLQKIENNELVEYSIFNDWYYGFDLQGIDYQNKEYVVIVTPAGVRHLQHKVGNGNVVSYYIAVSEHERLIRLAMRGDDINEIFRRLQADRNDFHMFQSEADHIIENVNIGQATCDILKLITNPKEKELH